MPHNASMIKDIKAIINDLKENEEVADKLGNRNMKSGIIIARCQLENLLEKHGCHRPATIKAAG